MQQNYGFEKFINRRELRNTIRYVVKSGDSLYKIAENFSTTVADIVNLNNLTTTMIYPNQILFIPSNDTNYVTLKDFLVSKNISIDGIANDTLDMKLKITKKQPDSKFYEVKYKDTLDTILEDTKLTPYQLIEYNKAKWLYPGEKIIIG